MPPLRSLALPTLAALAVGTIGLAAAKGGAGHAQRATSAVVHGRAATVNIANYIYSPSTLTVSAGTRLSVTNHDATAHTLTARTGGFDSGTIPSGKTISFTVGKPGLYTYYCQFHAFMHGTLRVVG